MLPCAGIINASSAQTWRETFESGTPLDDWSGDTGFYGTTSTAYEGSQAITLNADSTETLLLYDPVAAALDQWYTAAVRIDSDVTFPKLYLMATGPTGTRDGYLVEFSAGSAGEARLRRVDGGSSTTLSVFPSFDPRNYTNQYLTVDYRLTSAQVLEAEIYDASTSKRGTLLTSDTYDASGDATQYTSGAVGIGGYDGNIGGANIRFDDVGAYNP